jgi:hypothetical protein
MIRVLSHHINTGHLISVRDQQQLSPKQQVHEDTVSAQQKFLKSFAISRRTSVSLFCLFFSSQLA